LKNSFKVHLRNIKNDILTVGNIYSTKNNIFNNLGIDYHEWIREKKRIIIPNRNIINKNINYDKKVKPMDYLYGMIYMMKEIEKCGLKILNVFPQRTSMIPG
jgi:hypothetical protein